MARVLLVGQQPETVDFTNPMLPPGMNAERIHAGITLALKQMAERGWFQDSDATMIDVVIGTIVVALAAFEVWLAQDGERGIPTGH
jgi:hypothetical protein